MYANIIIYSKGHVYQYTYNQYTYILKDMYTNILIYSKGHVYQYTYIF